MDWNLDLTSFCRTVDYHLWTGLSIKSLQSHFYVRSSKNISASRKENEHILSNFCVCNIMVQSHWSKSQAVTLTSSTIQDLIVELDWTERSLRMLDLIAELIVSSLEWTGEKKWT